MDNRSDTVITLTHDIAGQKMLIDDAGVVDFAYNGFGELRRQIWAPGTYAASI